jgi:hypothetical protein
VSVLSDAKRGLQRLRTSGAIAELERRATLALTGDRPRVSAPPANITHGAAVVETPSTYAPLAVGWHPDPYRRWKARYWNGQRWTERVAKPGNGQPLFGIDVVVPSGDDPSAVASIVLLESFINGELVRLRGEVDKWRAIAEERGLALARLEGAMAVREAGRGGEHYATSE